jgi:hypothetical protein
MELCEAVVDKFGAPEGVMDLYDPEFRDWANRNRLTPIEDNWKTWDDLGRPRSRS